MRRQRDWRGDYQGSGMGRIDTRPQSDPAVQAGLRNIHRDTAGNVIGAKTPEGVSIGVNASKSRLGTSATPRLDAGVQTPRLDSNPSTPIRYKSAAARQAEDAAGAQKVALNGGFGQGAQAKAQNLEGRKSLFSRMQQAGAGGITPAMQKEAASLGVSGAGWRSALEKLPAAPAVFAGPNAAPSAAIPSTIAKPSGMAPAMAAPAPLVGAEKAKADMAKYGVMGAVQRSMDATAATKAASRQTAWRSATKSPAVKPMSPLPPKPSPQSLGLPATSATPTNPVAANNFSVPPSPVVQPVGAPQVQASPAIAPAVQSPAPSSSWRGASSAPSGEKNPVRFSAAPRGSTPKDAKAWAKELIAKDQANAIATQKRVDAAGNQPMPYGVDPQSIAAPIVRGFRRWRAAMNY